MTLAEIAAEIEAIEAELSASRSSTDFSTSAPGGGGLSVSGSASRRAELRKELRSLRRRYWAANGANVAEPARPGIDQQRRTSNNDDW
jgi:hypothetical protein